MQNGSITLADPRLLTLRRALSPWDSPPEVDPTTEGRIHAAVSIILREGEDLELLLIKRAEAERDPWSGQMALPGGRRDPSDSTLLRTAMRETEEEVSLHLGEKGIPLGRLSPTIPGSTRLPPITIFPYVFGVPAGVEARASSPEVDEVHWIPLSVFRDPDTLGEVEILYRDETRRTFPCWKVGERVIWGLTYRILAGLLELLEPQRI